MSPNDIKQLIEAGLTDAIATVESNDNVHFSAVVISPAFIGKNRVQQQQLVYATLGNHITNGTIHALSIKTTPIKTLTPSEHITNG